MVRVNLEVESEKKEKWEQYAQEHPESNGNLSAFVRACVEKEIAGGSENGIQSEELLKKLGELGDSINQVHERMDSMESRLSGLESETTTEPEIEELKGDVFDLLPDKEPGTQPWEQEKHELNDELQHTDSDSIRKQLLGYDGTIESLANAIDEPEFVVERCIERLQETTQLVRTVDYADETRYYKVI